MLLNMQHFHAHIYFELGRARDATRWALHAERSGLFEFIKLQAEAVGPHPSGMVEVHFFESSYAKVLTWLEKNQDSFSILIHHDTGDDIKDHSEGVRWLGDPLPIDFGFFELIKSRPDLRIHKPV